MTHDIIKSLSLLGPDLNTLDVPLRRPDYAEGGNRIVWVHWKWHVTVHIYIHLLYLPFSPFLFKDLYVELFVVCCTWTNKPPFITITFCQSFPPGVPALCPEEIPPLKGSCRPWSSLGNGHVAKPLASLNTPRWSSMILNALINILWSV